MWQRMPRREPSALTATLPLWEIIATRPGLERRDRVAPHRGPRADRDDAVAVRAAERSPPAERDLAQSRSSARPAAISPKPAESTTAPPQPRATAVGDDRRHPGGRDRDDEGIDGLGKVGHGGDAGPAVHLGRAAGSRPRRRLSNPARAEVAKHDVAVGARAVVGADHGDRARLEQSTGIDGASARGGLDL